MLLSGPFAARRLAACLDILDHLEANESGENSVANNDKRQTSANVCTLTVFSEACETNGVKLCKVVCSVC